MKNKIVLGLVGSAMLLNAVSLKNIEKNIDDLKLTNGKEFKVNLEKLLLKMPNNISIDNIIKLKNSSSIMAIISDENGAKLPIFINQDGTIINSISQVFVSDDSLSAEIEEFLKANLTLDQEVNAEKAILNKKIKETVEKIPQEYSVKLESNNKNSKFEAIIISDPECPYCRMHLNNELSKMLEEMSVNIYFAPVHEVPSYIKAQLILNETNKAKTTKEKIAILNKYYDENYILSENDKKTDYKKVETYRNIILNETGITGVPNISVYEKK